MIVVIADDFSGSAEVAGIGLKFGLSVQVQTHFNPTAISEMVIIDSHTRSIDQAQAKLRIKSIMAGTTDVRIEWLYKKGSSTNGEMILEGFKDARIRVKRFTISKPQWFCLIIICQKS